MEPNFHKIIDDKDFETGAFSAARIGCGDCLKFNRVDKKFLYSNYLRGKGLVK